MVIAKLYALGCICIKGELLSLPKVIFLLGNDKISGCLAFAKFVEISPDSLTVSTNPAQSIQEEQKMTNIQIEIKAKCQNLGSIGQSLGPVASDDGSRLEILLSYILTLLFR